MECQPYITATEFKDSAYFCSLPDCCIPTGGTIDDVINPLILEAQVLINSYLGWEVCILPRSDYFIGDDSKSYFTEYCPIDPTNGYTLEIRQNNPQYFTGNQTISTIDQTDGNLRISDAKCGLIRYQRSFRRSQELKFNYEAGYAVIPDEIKVAMKMMVLSLAQRLDNMALNNPDFTLDNINVDKSMNISYGSGKTIKNVVLKSLSELSDLPLPVRKILDRFKINKLS